MTQPLDWKYPGSRWWKFDFHTHTPESLDTYAWQNAINTPDEVTPEKWLLQYMVAEMDCVAITDHNSGAWIDKLKAAYAQMQANPPAGFRELYLFPGIELSVNGGFHLLAIFDIDATTSKIDALLGKVDYKGTLGDTDGVTGKSGVDVIDAILSMGGIPIPAHVDQPKGLLCQRQTEPEKHHSVLDAQTLLQILNHRGILAMERIDLNVPLPGSYRENQTHWADVVGSDCHTFQGDAVPGSRYTWVKMAIPSLEGLRFALLDGNDISLRRWDATDFEPFKLPEHFIEEISIEKARYMGGRGNSETLRFSPYFNALIGGRGTGKSTVVHALRLAYNRKSELDGFDGKSGPLHTFNEFNRLPQDRYDRGGLQTQTQITAILVHDGRRHRLRWRRQDGQDVIVVEELVGENWRESISQAVNSDRFPLRLFSQGQIASMADENRQGLLSVIDEAANVQSKKQDYEEAKRALSSLRAQLRELEAKLTGRDEIQRKLEDVQRKIQSLEQNQYSEAFKSFQRAHRQRGEVETQFEHFFEWIGRIGAFAGEISLDDIPAGTFDDAADTDVLEVLASLRQALTKSGQSIQAIASDLERNGQTLQSDARLQAWRERVAAREVQYEELKSALAAQGVTDPAQFANLLQERQSLQIQAAGLDTLADQRGVAIERVRKQEQIILEARREITAARQRFLEENLENNFYVHIEVEPFGYDARTLERSLRECLDITDDRFESDILEMDGDKPSRGLIANLLSGKDKLVVLEGVRQKLLDVSDDFNGKFRTYLQKRQSNQPESVDRIQTWFPEDDLCIEYSQKGDGKGFKPITQGSAGQRAAAILAFLLAFGEEPIVLDQPEDDLDNHLIYDLVVRQIRANKLRRQLIIVTHNPNIVVNGDAEMIHALDFRGGQCSVQESGALQEESVRDEVCRIMEGGQDAFARRWHRLGKEL